MAFSTTAANLILDAMLSATAYSETAAYISLHTADPGSTGASEVVGGSYARQLAAFAAGAGKTSDNDDIEDFTAMPAVTVTHAGIWDAVTTGNFVIGGALTASKVVNSGDTFRFPAGDVDVTLT